MEKPVWFRKSRLSQHMIVQLKAFHTVLSGHADYAATKAAMMGGFMLSLKNELVAIAPRGRINTISPGKRVTLE